MVARLPQPPACSVDWSRPFSLPLAIAPDLDAANRLTYVRSLGIHGELLNSTLDGYRTASPPGNVVRFVMDSADQVLLPQDTAYLSSTQVLSTAAVKSVTRRAADGFLSGAMPSGSLPEDIEAILAGSVLRDDVSRQVSDLSIPWTGLDALRFYWPSQDSAGLADTLGISIPAAVPGDAFPNPPPSYLLQTQSARANPTPQPLVLGELSRMVLRSPVNGSLRFEPYLHYGLKSPSQLVALGRSNSGRLLIQVPEVPANSLVGTPDETETLVFRGRLLVFEHVDRTSVASMLHQMLMLQFGMFEQIVGQWRGTDAAQQRFAVPKTRVKTYLGLVDGIKGLLRGWAAFLVALATAPEDLAVAADVARQVWLKDLTPTHAGANDDNKILSIVKEVGQNKAWLNSIVRFSEKLYSSILAGFSWTEALKAIGVPASRRFPGVSDDKPYTPKAPSAIAAYERLRQIQNPEFQWVACYAGCPVGTPSPVYAATAPLPGAKGFPDGGLTTFEVEALHLAGWASDALVGDGSLNSKPKASPSASMDMTPFEPKRVGHACVFESARLSANAFHSHLDWLLDLLRGTQRRQEEPGWLDLQAYLDATNRDVGHPLARPLRMDEHYKAVALRAQMDGLGATDVDFEQFGWWQAKAKRPGIGGLTPNRAYLDRGTKPKRPNGSTLAFGEVRPAPPATSPFKTGLSAFDIESVYLANSRLASPLPMPVLLALLETEGVNLFSAPNRCTGFSRAEAVHWESETTGLAGHQLALLNFQKVFEEGGETLVGRFSWLQWPYGLDEFMVKTDWTADVQKQPGESDADFSTRLLTDFVGTPGKSVWLGWSNGPGRMTNPDGRFNFKFSSRLATPGIVPLAPSEDVAAYIRLRLAAHFQPTGMFPLPSGGTAPIGKVRVWKKTQRVHWAIISLMASWFQMRERDILNETGGCLTPDKASWLPAASSPPDLTGQTPTSDAWRDFISYYALIYLAYNAGPGSLAADTAAADADRIASASPLNPRAYLLLKHQPGAAFELGLTNVVRFSVALEAYMRLNFMEGLQPQGYASAAADTSSIQASTARWGL